MKYVFTQLKDLPKSKAGTKYLCSGIEMRYPDTFRGSQIEKIPYYRILIPEGYGSSSVKSYRIEYALVGSSLLDDPEWFKKEIDYDHLTEMRCPKCGGTKFSVSKKNWYVRDMDSDDYGSHNVTTFECPCGYSIVI